MAVCEVCNCAVDGTLRVCWRALRKNRAEQVWTALRPPHGSAGENGREETERNLTLECPSFKSVPSAVRALDGQAISHHRDADRQTLDRGV